MKKIRFLVFLLVIFMARPVHAMAESPGKAPDVKKIRCTCYHSGNFTASGDYPYQGVAAYRPEDIGKTAYLWEIGEDGEVGNFIGQYDILDTGGNAVKKGYVFDVWRMSEEDCRAFSKEHGDYVYIRIEGENE